MNSKRGAGLMGSVIVLFVATIAIVIILVLFTLAAGVIKSMDGVDKGIKVHDERDTSIRSLFDYRAELISFEKLKSDYFQKRIR